MGNQHPKLGEDCSIGKRFVTFTSRALRS